MYSYNYFKRKFQNGEEILIMFVNKYGKIEKNHHFVRMTQKLYTCVLQVSPMMDYKSWKLVWDYLAPTATWRYKLPCSIMAMGLHKHMSFVFCQEQLQYF